MLAIWRDEFKELFDWGGACTIVMHPQVTGRPIRLATLREYDRVWYATCEEIARAFEEHK